MAIFCRFLEKVLAIDKFEVWVYNGNKVRYDFRKEELMIRLVSPEAVQARQTCLGEIVWDEVRCGEPTVKKWTCDVQNRIIL